MTPRSCLPCYLAERRGWFHLFAPGWFCWRCGVMLYAGLPPRRTDPSYRRLTRALDLANRRTSTTLRDYRLN